MMDFMTVIGDVKDASLGLVRALYMTVDTRSGIAKSLLFQAYGGRLGAAFGETGIRDDTGEMTRSARSSITSKEGDP